MDFKILNFKLLMNDCTLKVFIIKGECNLITECLSLLKPNYLRKCLFKIIEDIGLINVIDDITAMFN